MELSLLIAMIEIMIWSQLFSNSYEKSLRFWILDVGMCCVIKRNMPIGSWERMHQWATSSLFTLTFTHKSEESLCCWLNKWFQFCGLFDFLWVTGSASPTNLTTPWIHNASACLPVWAPSLSHCLGRSCRQVLPFPKHRQKAAIEHVCYQSMLPGPRHRS